MIPSRPSVTTPHVEVRILQTESKQLHLAPHEIEDIENVTYIDNSSAADTFSIRLVNKDHKYTDDPRFLEGSGIIIYLGYKHESRQMIQGVITKINYHFGEQSSIEVKGIDMEAIMHVSSTPRTFKYDGKFQTLLGEKRASAFQEVVSQTLTTKSSGAGKQSTKAVHKRFRDSDIIKILAEENKVAAEGQRQPGYPDHVRWFDGYYIVETETQIPENHEYWYRKPAESQPAGMSDIALIRKIAKKHFWDAFSRSHTVVENGKEVTKNYLFFMPPRFTAKPHYTFLFRMAERSNISSVNLELVSHKIDQFKYMNINHNTGEVVTKEASLEPENDFSGATSPMDVKEAMKLGLFVTESDDVLHGRAFTGQHISTPTSHIGSTQKPTVHHDPDTLQNTVNSEFLQGTYVMELKGNLGYGLPEMRSRQTLRIGGLAARFTGRYYVTQVKHTYEPGSGYQTTFSSWSNSVGPTAITSHRTDSDLINEANIELSREDLGSMVNRISATTAAGSIDTATAQAVLYGTQQ